MNRDGFSLLAMGFTGKKALQFKLKYIDVFKVTTAFVSRFIFYNFLPKKRKKICAECNYSILLYYVIKNTIL